MPLPSPKFSNAAISIVRTLVSRGYEAYIVGGAVRDYLLNHHPKDFDIATSATPEQVRDVFTRRRARIIGKRFRLCHVIADGVIFEVSTFRREPTEEERKGRKDDHGTIIWSDNVYGTLQDDVKRRDFTVNALYYDAAGTGEIVDLCGGVQDAKNRIVNVLGVPEVRFQEDPVRMLRALKLVGQHGFTLSPAVARALRENAPQMEMASQARLVEEIFKILSTGKALPIFEACRKYGLLRYLLPVLDQFWTKPVGNATRRLLAERDAAIHEEKEYSSSRSLGLATLCFPFLQAELSLNNPDFRRTFEADELCLKKLHTFLQRYAIPHVMSLDVKDIVMMLPTLANGGKIYRALRHPRYPEAYELYRLLAITQEWQVPRFLELPFPEEEIPEAPAWGDGNNIHVPRKTSR